MAELPKDMNPYGGLGLLLFLVFYNIRDANIAREAKQAVNIDKEEEIKVPY